MTTDNKHWVVQKCYKSWTAKKLLTTEKMYDIIYELSLNESLMTKNNKKVVDKELKVC